MNGRLASGFAWFFGVRAGKAKDTIPCMKKGLLREGQVDTAVMTVLDSAK
jgi:hypothetical protein